MWVYGDRTRRVRPAELLAEAEAAWRAGDGVSALVGLGQLIQGVADAEFAQRGCDARSPVTDALMAAMMGAAGASAAPAPDFASLEASLKRSAPEALQVRVPEGYAFYALHPALYAAAARQLPPADWRVIGIRSIGASLSAAAAAVLGAPPPATVRPVGPPFERELRLSPELRAEWALHAGRFVVVDEGPGLSGSSFGAVADALERLGVGRERIAFLPGHGGDLGPQASPEHRARWAGALRPVAEFDAVVLPELDRAVEALVGPATAPMRDISGGGWRSLRGWSDPPPINAGQERRKFLHETREGRWLVKFAGLGPIGAAKLERARALAGAGLTPEPAGVAEGFLVERWIEGAGPLNGKPLQRLGELLVARSKLPAETEEGASLVDLAEMLRVNAGEALGPAAAEAAGRWAGRARLLERGVERVHVDGRLHRWEWLAPPSGRPLKTDAVDHSQAHDLVGPQDIRWDLAGAEFEFDLTPGETEGLRPDLSVSDPLFGFMRLAYPAFQLGLWTMAADAQAGWPEEAARARGQARRYRRRLAALLGVDPTPARS